MEVSYEDSRKQRMEENKRRMEELGLMKLSSSMAKPKVVREKKKRPTLEEQGLERRRSTRVAAYQANEELARVRDFEESDEDDSNGSKSFRVIDSESEASDKSDDSESDEEEPGTPVVRRQYTLRRTRKSPPREDISDGHVEATEAAEDIEKDLENPGFVVSLQELHVTTDFLEVPEIFRMANLPASDDDESITLQDAEAKEWGTTFITSSGVLGDGWLNFVQHHKLDIGDACVFELLSSNKFKVHLVRASEQAAATGKSSSRKRVKREMKVVDGQEVTDVDGTSGGEKNGEEGSEDDWKPESSSEEEAEDDDDDNWRPED